MNNINEDLQKMLKDISQNNLTFKTYEEYYNCIKACNESGLLEETLKYFNSLYSATTIIKSYKEEDAYHQSQNDLQDLITKELLQRIDINQLKEELEKLLYATFLTIENYGNYCAKLELSLLIKLDINYTDYIKALQTVKIFPQNYEEYEKLELYQKRLLNIVNKTNKVKIRKTYINKNI